eukprot:9337-Heterococcus_DN1.PRE.10
MPLMSAAIRSMQLHRLSSSTTSDAQHSWPYFSKQKPLLYTAQRRLVHAQARCMTYVSGVSTFGSL